MMKKQQKKVIPQKPVAVKGNEKSDIKWELFIASVAVVSFCFSLFNAYALDDFIVLFQNTFVQEGVSGIWKILSMDTFAGMSAANVMVLAGGRYRPLSVVTFAMEHQLWGNKPFIAHLINIVIYVAIGILLFRLLKKLLAFHSAGNEWATTKSALISLLFIALPVHSEPVINIKGRDDLMCLMFFLLSIFQLLKYVKTKSSKNFFYTCLFYFLSLMSKETALTFVLIFPLILYFFTNAKSAEKTKTTAAYFSLALLFLLFRYLATKDNGGTVSNDVLNNPFVNATFQERYATIFLTWVYYIMLMIFPLHLSYDYNFNQFPLTNFSDLRVIFSIVLHIALLVFALSRFRKKSIYSFSILFYLITFSILSNFFFNIGSIFADRFLFIPSLGFCIAIVYLVFDYIDRLKTKESKDSLRKIGAGIFVTVIILSCFRNYSRCLDWKDNNTLFVADTDEAPQSAKVQLNAGLAFISMAEPAQGSVRDSLLYTAMTYLQKGIKIYPTYIDGYQNMGVVYNWLLKYDSAETWWDKVKEINPEYNQIPNNNKVLGYWFFHKGIDYGAKRDFNASINFLTKALRYDSLNADLFYNLGGAYFTINRLDSAEYFFRKTLEVNPNHPNAVQGLQALGKVKQ